jgi:tripartite-type tricarboxylate transporter receptor subunit TctC
MSRWTVAGGLYELETLPLASNGMGDVYHGRDTVCASVPRHRAPEAPGVPTIHDVGVDTKIGSCRMASAMHATGPETTGPTRLTCPVSPKQPFLPVSAVTYGDSP